MEGEREEGGKYLPPQCPLLSVQHCIFFTQDSQASYDWGKTWVSFLTLLLSLVLQIIYERRSSLSALPTVTKLISGSVRFGAQVTCWLIFFWPRSFLSRRNQSPVPWPVPQLTHRTGACSAILVLPSLHRSVGVQITGQKSVKEKQVMQFPADDCPGSVLRVEKPHKVQNDSLIAITCKQLQQPSSASSFLWSFWVVCRIEGQTSAGWRDRPL